MVTFWRCITGREPKLKALTQVLLARALTNMGLGFISQPISGPRCPTPQRNKLEMMGSCSQSWEVKTNQRSSEPMLTWKTPSLSMVLSTRICVTSPFPTMQCSAKSTTSESPQASGVGECDRDLLIRFLLIFDVSANGLRGPFAHCSDEIG